MAQMANPNPNPKRCMARRWEHVLCCCGLVFFIPTKPYPYRSEADAEAVAQELEQQNRVPSPKPKPKPSSSLKATTEHLNLTSRARAAE